MLEQKTATIENLTDRERCVAALIVKGFNREQMATELVVSAHTIRNHIASILKKSNCKNQREFIVKYL